MKFNHYVEKIGKIACHKKVIISTAESCTGGWIAQAMTAVSGSSSWFDSGFVTYSNLAKQRMLEVSATLLTNEGAVSAAVVKAMAQGAIKNSEANLAVAVSGIAGPRGGTKDKPIGTVWIAWGKEGEEPEAKKYLFTGNRKQIRSQTVEKALQGILRHLSN